MPAVQRSEFALALNQVASERGVDVSVVLETVQNAILAAYRKDHPGVEVDEYSAILDSNTGEAKIFNGDEDVTPPGFGRIAAQTAKQVILQKIREKEKEAIFTDYRDKIGTIVNGMVLRFAGPNIIVDIGKTEAIMPVSEQIPNEKYHLNQRLAFYLSEIREGMKGEEIVVSRADNGLIEGLFKREVPEVAQGSVEIKTVVREPGNRAKIAVFSQQPGIDPVGSCVGQKGVRVQAIIQELGGLEKIDIIQWSDDPKTYIAQALSPAKNVRVELDEKEKIAHVFVPQDELSLAIGKDGQNVRLAYKLTQYRIEIEGEGEPTKPAETAVEKKAASDAVDNGKKKSATSTSSVAVANAKEEAEVLAAENEEAEAKEEIAEDVVDDEAKPVVDDAGSLEVKVTPSDADVKQVAPSAETPSDEQASTQANEESTPEMPAVDDAEVSEAEEGSLEEEEIKTASPEEPTEEQVESTPDVAPVEEPVSAPVADASDEREDVIPDEDSGVNPNPVLDVSEDAEDVSVDSSADSTDDKSDAGSAGADGQVSDDESSNGEESTETPDADEGKEAA